VILIKPR